jgi:hypothetical protein
MLGEFLGEEYGQITGIRVPPSEGPGPAIEASYQASGKLFGYEIMDLGTYTAVPRPGGFLLGQGQGLIMTQDGETVAWTGQGVGKPTGKGPAASWRGAVYYATESQKLARLNGMAVVYEYEVDENGKTHAKIWEWK